jgi:RNA polymerase sigma-70 factor, ECF subfamily
VALRTLHDPEDAADALQEAMISAFRRAADFRGDAAVTTWLHRIVVNACLDQLRRKAARPTAHVPDEETLDALGPPPAGSTADPGTASDTALDVRAALRRLPVEQQAALVLVDMLGYSVAVTADILGVSTGTVKSRCARGRARLLPYVKHLGPGPDPGPAPGTDPQPRNRTAAADVSPSQPPAAISPERGEHTP